VMMVMMMMMMMTTNGKENPHQAPFWRGGT